MIFPFLFLLCSFLVKTMSIIDTLNPQVGSFYFFVFSIALSYLAVWGLLMLLGGMTFAAAETAEAETVEVEVEVEESEVEVDEDKEGV